MNDVIKSLLTRRSIRAFKEEVIAKEDLLGIAKAGVYAPSGRGLQTWKFTIVSNQEQIGKLAAVIGKELGRNGYDLYKPVALIIPSNLADSPFGKEDNACALENIFLAAHSLGIGSVWINQLQGICDKPAIRELLTAWDIPADHVVYGFAALGYPQDEAQKEVVKTGEIHIVEA